MAINIGRLIVCFVLLIGLALVTRRASKILSVSPWGVDEKSDFRASMKALVYLFVAGIAVLLFVHGLGVVGTLFGVILALLLVMTVVFTLIDLPARMSRVDGLLWHEGPTTPGYSRSGEPVPYVRWARRFAMVLFVLFVFAAALLGGGGPNAPVSANGGTTPTVAPTTGPPTTTPAAPATAVPPQPTAAPPTSAPPSAPVTEQYSDNPCDGPKQIEKVDQPSLVSFTTSNVQVCYNGKWQSWGNVTSIAPPSQIRVDYWTVQGSYGYGRVVDPRTGDPYTIRTSHFR